MEINTQENGPWENMQVKDCMNIFMEKNIKVIFNKVKGREKEF